MKAFPTPVSRWTPVHEDKAPEVQGGVNSDINGEKTVRWYGRLSELAAGGRAIKFPKGYLPERYVIKAEKIVDNVGIYGCAVELAEDTDVTLSAAAKKRAADGTTSVTGESGATFSDVHIKGPYDGSDSDSDADENTATYGVVASGTCTGALVTDHDEYVVLTASGGSGLDRATNDCFVDVRFIVRQVDPMVEFHH